MQPNCVNACVLPLLLLLLQEGRLADGGEGGCHITALFSSSEPTASLSAGVLTAFSGMTGDLVTATLTLQKQLMLQQLQAAVKAVAVWLGDGSGSEIFPTTPPQCPLRGKQVCTSCGRKWPERAKCFETLSANLKNVSVTNHGRKYCAQTQMEVRRLQQYHCYTNTSQMVRGDLVSLYKASTWENGF